MNTPSSIQVGFCEGTVWVRVSGKGNFQNSTPLKDFAREMLARGNRKFVVDLAECPMMDSTFMGTLAGIALKLRGCENGGSVRIVRLNARNRDLLSNLGLDQLLSIEPEASTDACVPDETRTLSSAPGDKTEQARTMLEAHEAVVEVNPENEAKFKDVLEFLRNDLEAKH